MQVSVSTAPQILRLKTVKEITALSRSTIYGEIKAGRFPKQVHLTSKCVGWLADEILSYIQVRAEARNLMKEAA